MKLNESLVEKLQSISWFCKCGTPSPFDWAVSAASTKEVLKAINSRKWENMILDAQGNVTEQLSIRSIKKIGHEEREWNNLVLDFKERHLAKLKEQLELALVPSGLNTPDILNDVSFNILSIAVTDAYKEIVPVPSFFLQLLEVYEMGYLPCGWKGAATTGKFIVY